MALALSAEKESETIKTGWVDGVGEVVLDHDELALTLNGSQDTEWDDDDEDRCFFEIVSLPLLVWFFWVRDEFNFLLD